MLIDHPARRRGETCAECSEPPLDGGRRCETHRAAHNAREAQRRAQMRKARRCTVCGERAEKDRRYCREHLEYYAERDRARRANGR